MSILWLHWIVKSFQNHEVQIHRDQIDERDKHELISQQTYLWFTYQRFEMPAPVWCIPTSSQPLKRRTNTSPSCCPVWPCFVSPQSELNYKYYVHHTKKRTIFVLLWTIWFNYKRVWRDTYSMRCHWKWHRRSRKIIGLSLCVHSVTRNGEWQGETSCTCGRRILEWCWGEALLGWTIHFHLLQELQSTTIIQQGELSITNVLP